MTMPTNRPSTDGLEGRLQAVFERDVARAGGQLANGEIVLGRRSSSRLVRFATSPAAITAAAVVVLALIVGAVSWKAGPNPPVAGSGPANAPGSAIPSFEEPVWPVGEGALEQIQASRTDAPFLISGWLIGAAPNPQCQGMASPSAVSAIDPCAAVTLHASPVGGAELTILAVNMPPLAADQARQVVLRVHTHDASCGTDASCGADAVVSAVAWAGELVQLPIAPPSELAGNGTIDGPVYPVGNGAEERAAAALKGNTADATPFLVSGWLIGTGTEVACASSSGASIDPGNPVPCHTVELYPDRGGGVSWVLDSPYAVATPAVDPGMARHVVVRVGPRDAAWYATCRAEGTCTGSMLLLAVVQADDQTAVATQPSGLPPNAISQQEAEEAAARIAYGGTFSPDLAISSSQLWPLGTSTPLWPSVDANRWVWTVVLAHVGDGSADQVIVVVDAVTGEGLGSWSQPLAVSAPPPPGPTIPTMIGQIPVHVGDGARSALGQSSGVPLLIGGWIQGLDRRVCDPEANLTRSGLWNPCAGFWLYDTPDGGAPLVILNGGAPTPTGALAASWNPADGEAVPVVLRVANAHASFAGAAEGVYPFADEVIWAGTPVKTLDIGAAPAGVSVATAERAGQLYLVDHGLTTLRVSARITLRAYTAIAGGSFSAPGESQDSWVWLLLYTDGSGSPSSAQAVLVSLVSGRPIGGTGTFP